MLHLYAIARRRRPQELEFYTPVNGGQAIGWTDDLNHAWCIHIEEWADMVLFEIHRNGHFDAFIHAFRGELGEHDTGAANDP